MGEYSSASYDPNCSADTVGTIYEVLEVLLYEVIGVALASRSVYTAKVVSTLMSAISKVQYTYSIQGFCSNYLIADFI